MTYIQNDGQHTSAATNKPETIWPPKVWLLHLEYTRTDLIQPMIDKAVAEALERVLEIIEDLATVDGCFGDADEAIRAMIKEGKL